MAQKYKGLRYPATPLISDGQARRPDSGYYPTVLERVRHADLETGHALAVKTVKILSGKPVVILCVGSLCIG